MVKDALVLFVNANWKNNRNFFFGRPFKLMCTKLKKIAKKINSKVGAFAKMQALQILQSLHGNFGLLQGGGSCVTDKAN